GTFAVVRVGAREPRGGGEDAARSADGRVAAQERGLLAERGGEAARPEHDHPRARGERGDEYAHAILEPLALGAVGQRRVAADGEQPPRVVDDRVVRPVRADRPLRRRETYADSAPDATGIGARGQASGR